MSPPNSVSETPPDPKRPPPDPNRRLSPNPRTPVSKHLQRLPARPTLFRLSCRSQYKPAVKLQGQESQKSAPQPCVQMLEMRSVTRSWVWGKTAYHPLFQVPIGDRERGPSGCRDAFPNDRRRPNAKQRLPSGVSLQFGTKHEWNGCRNEEPRMLRGRWNPRSFACGLVPLASCFRMTCNAKETVSQRTNYPRLDAHFS